MCKKETNDGQFPLFETLIKQKKRIKCRFHVPAHVVGANISKAYEYDYTELPGLDNLYNPQGVIADSLKLAAEFYKSEKTYYLVNGSSAAMVAALWSFCRPGEKVLVGRNFHRSLVAGLVLSGARPSFIPVTMYNPEIPLNVDIQDVKSLLDLDNYKAIIITSPSYWGITPELDLLCREARKRSVSVIVDEAHGGHFIFDDRFPFSASSCMADIWFNSAHKTMGALTPGALLHLRGKEVDISRLEYALSTMQTSSPPYPVLASLELIRKENGGWAEIIELSFYAMEKANKLKCFNLLGRSNLPPGFFIDPLRLVFITEKISLNGFEIIEVLGDRFGIEVEMSGIAYFVVLLQRGHTREDVDYLIKSLKEIETDYGDGSNHINLSAGDTNIPKLVLTPREAVDSAWQEVDLSDACGRISAATVSSFPPGIPSLIPGEIISDESISLIKENHKRGYFFTGIKTNRDLKINVVAE